MQPMFRFLLGLVVIAGMAFASVFLGVIALGVLAALAIAGAFLRWRLVRAVKREITAMQERVNAHRGPDAIEGEYRVIEAPVSDTSDASHSR